jgi:hypothetical protein
MIARGTKAVFRSFIWTNNTDAMAFLDFRQITADAWIHNTFLSKDFDDEQEGWKRKVHR